MASSPHHHSGSGFGWRWVIALAFFALAASFLLSAEHRAHAVGLFPLLALLALCPLMHVFMHGGHGGHEPATDEEADAAAAEPAARKRGVEGKSGSVRVDLGGRRL